MLSQKTKGLFLEVNDFSVLAAVTSSLEPPLTIERIYEKNADADVEEIKEFLSGLADGKSRGFVPGRCGIYPNSRFVRRTTLESPARAKEPSYFAELLSSQFRIDPAKNSVAIVNAIDGSEFDLEKGAQHQKELAFVGASTEDIQKEQNKLVDWGVYPDTLEIGSLASVGGLISYVKWKKIKFPTLVLEITPSTSNIFIISGDHLDISRPIPYGLNSMFPTIQSELGLKDEESARKLFYSNTFDFTEMGPALLKKMLKELQASTGFYEVQTGQTIGQIFLTLLPKNFYWIHNTLSRALGVDVLQLDYPGWLKTLNISAGPNVQIESLDSRWLGVFSLMGQYQNKAENGTEEA